MLFGLSTTRLIFFKKISCSNFVEEKIHNLDKKYIKSKGDQSNPKKKINKH